MTPTDSIPRRSFLRGSLLLAAALGGTSRAAAQPRPTSGRDPATDGGFIVDTNVNIGAWPFRSLKHGATRELAAKLQKHKIRQAWTGSFDALFHKNIDRVNARLAEDCRAQGAGVLVPFGTVNPAFPDWEEDLRRCHEVYRMPGIRLHPVYHGYTLEDARFRELLDRATRRGLLVQVAIDMEDERMQHPLVDVAAVDTTPLPGVLAQVAGARVMLVNAFRHVRGPKLKALVVRTSVTFEFSNLEGTAGVELMLQGKNAGPGAGTIPLERLMFGSHAPFFPVEAALFKLVESPFTRAQIDALAFGNAGRLLPRA